MTAIRTVASKRTASSPNLVATARWRLSRLSPHATARRALQSSRSKAHQPAFSLDLGNAAMRLSRISSNRPLAQVSMETLLCRA